MPPATLAASTLDPLQRRFLDAFAAGPLRDAFYLTGGTALSAFYLHHRESEDLDFFSDDEVPLQDVQGFVRSVAGFSLESFTRHHSRRLFLLRAGERALKVEFTHYAFTGQFPRALVDIGFAIDTVEEILVNKVLAICDRREPKDEVDLWFLLQARVLPSLGEAIALAERKSSLRGLRYVLQQRLLAIHADLPSTTPPVGRERISADFRREVEALVRQSLV